MHPLRSLFALSLLTLPTIAADPTTLTIHTDKPGIQVPKSLYGIFFEDISRSADGGLYAELLQNRSFEDAPTPVAWEISTQSPDQATVSVDSAHPLNPDNPHYLNVTLHKPANVTLTNTGFHGIPVRQGATYTLALRSRSETESPLTATLLSSTGIPLATTTLKPMAYRPLVWSELTATLTPSATDPHAKLLLTLSASASLDQISLLPNDTWKSRNLRPDLATLLDDMKPAFVRFPGGCWVEGDTMATAYRWKKTVGPQDRRATVYNLWKYHATNALGYHEYLQLCEDLNADAMYVANVGMSHKENVPMDQMHVWVQDALDAIEYATGDASTRYGAMRAANGHPAPFNLKYLQIGNENGGPAYDERYALFYDAVKRKYPHITTIACLWNGMPKSRPIELLDEHYYNDPAFFIQNADRYDNYDRTKYKVYVGEYAVTRGAVGKGNLRAAVAEAAFMTGMERNSDVVQLASYAPLFAHTRYTAWNPNAINFDNHRSFGTPSYYVQQLFSRNRPDHILPLQITSPTPATPEPRAGQVGIGTWLTQAEFKDLKVEQGGKVLFQSDFAKGLTGFTNFAGDWRIRGGNVRQMSNQEACFALAGDPAWSDYTLSVKAKKFHGNEGFLVRFHSTSDKDYAMWNLGGWRNTKTAVEVSRDGSMSTISSESPVTIEPQRWYDIRIETKADRVKCFLDGQLIHEFTYPRTRSLYAVAGRSGPDVVLKVANVSADPQPATINLEGLTAAPAPAAAVTTLTSESPDDENTLEHPTKVSPKTTEIDVPGKSLPYTFPPNSVTVLRVKTRS
jgi:alpha-L-arabinofuranosidase